MKINKLLPISLILVMGIMDAKNQCFRPYNINIVNKSGGVATFLNGKDIAGMVKGSTINNSRTKRLQVNDMGARATFEVGPEEQKQKVNVSLFDVTGANPHVVLEPKSVKAFDVNTTHGKTYSVSIKNESGGVATITGCSAKDMKIANGSSGQLNVHAGAMATVTAGREGRKNMYVIHFFEKTGEAPRVILGGGEFFSSGVKGRNVNIKVNNAVQARLAMGLGPKRRQAAPVKQAQPMKKQAKQVKSPMRKANTARNSVAA